MLGEQLAWLNIVFLVLGTFFLVMMFVNENFGILSVIFYLLAVPAKDCLTSTECLFTSPDLTLGNIAVVSAILIVTIVVILLLLTLIGRQWTTAMSPREPRTLQEKIDQVSPGSCFIFPNGRGGWKEYRKNEDSTVTPGETYKTKDDVPWFYNVK